MSPKGLRICLESGMNMQILKKTKVLFLGVAFKENCSDIRNSKIFDAIDYLEKKGSKVHVYDPLIPLNILKKKIKNIKIKLNLKNYFDAVVISVGHELFLKMGIKNIKKLIKKNGLILDLKSIFPTNQSDWQL